jgi:methanogenic corrinoid protein MtbC1
MSRTAAFNRSLGMDHPEKQPFDFVDAYRRYLAGLLSSDRQQCRVSFTQWLESNSDLRTLYEDLVQRSLYEVGELWERGQLSVATEHLATAITESLLNLTYPLLFSHPRVGKTAIVTCVASEYHQIGAKMIADLFELNGWRGYFLGANTPLRDLTVLITEKHPDVVALSVTVAFNLDEIINFANEIRKTFSDLPIIVGGQAFRWGGRERVERLPGVRCLTTLSELQKWILEN